MPFQRFYVRGSPRGDQLFAGVAVGATVFANPGRIQHCLQNRDARRTSCPRIRDCLHVAEQFHRAEPRSSRPSQQ